MKCGDPNNPGGVGHKANGDPCQRQVFPGMTRCNLHGGANPAAKIKAEQMLAQARLPACEALYEIIDTWQRAECAICHHPSADVDMLKTIIRAAQVILDRTGVGPRSTVEVTKQSDGDLDLDLLTDVEMEQLDLLLGQLKDFKQGVRVRLGMVPVGTQSTTVQ